MVAAGRTAAPEQLVPAGALRPLSIDVGPTGLILGQDGAGRPVPVRLFRPESTTVTLVGGRWVAQVLVFRCLAVGATALVPDAPQWMMLDRLAGGDRVRALPASGDRLPPVAAHVTRPVLHVHDAGAAGPGVRPPPSAWQTELIVLPQVTPGGAHLLAGADLVLSRRLGDAELALAAEVLALDAPTVAMLRGTGADTVVALRGGNDRYVWLAPTSIERELFGEPGP